MITTFNDLHKKAFENIVVKGENASNQHFLLFPQCFLPFPIQISIFQLHFFLSSANAFNLDRSKILSIGEKLNTVPLGQKTIRKTINVSVVLEFNTNITAWVISWQSMKHLRVSRLSHTSTDKTLFPKSLATFFHMHQRWEEEKSKLDKK